LIAMSRLEQITARLEAITSELIDPGVDDDRAAELTKEAAELTAEATQEVNRALREAPPDE
jgi:exonuclease VII small subunit